MWANMLKPDTLYQYHLYSKKVSIFSYPYGTHALTNEAVIFDFAIRSDQDITYCRCYYFIVHWMSIFVTFDSSLQLKPDPDFNFPFAFNCDITTPHYIRGESLYTTDVLLDILVAPDGVTYMIEDEDQFYQAYEDKIFGSVWYENALKALDWWCKLLDKGDFIEYLNGVASFPREMTNNTEPCLVGQPINTVPFIHHPHYPISQ